MKLALLMLLALGGVAHADPAMPWTIPSPRTAVGRVVVEADLTRHHELAPLTVAPDLVVGVTPRFGLLLRASRAAEGRTGAGNGVCVVPGMETINEPAADCAELVSGAGVTALVRVVEGVTARAGITARHWAPRKLAAELGVAGALRRGRLWTVAAPAIVLGIDGPNDGNRDRVEAPIYGGLTLGRTDLHLRTGFEATLHTFFATWAVPVAVGASVRVGRFQLGAELSLDKLLGPLNNPSWRSASVFVQTSLGGS